ncbi:uncharacterized protein LOC136037836 isoform X1 [Artemia franciscana]|uniref:uncharacterized protein LOC136037836 isoform X1 n=1 Tax=Artemia franciscana TaxID=6661 RepID=UPI0032DBF1F2
MPCNRVSNKPRSLQAARPRKCKNNQRKNRGSVGKPEKCYVHRKKQEAFQKRGRQNPCGESVKSVPGTLKGFRKIALGLRSRIGEVDDTSQIFQLGSPNAFYTSETSNKEEREPLLLNSSLNKTKDIPLISVADSVTKCQSDVSSILPNENVEGEDICHKSITESIQMPQLHSVLPSVPNTVEVDKTMPQLLDSRLNVEENTSVMSINDSVEKSPRTLTSNNCEDLKCNCQKSDSQSQIIITKKAGEKKIPFQEETSTIIPNPQLLVGDFILTQDAELDTAQNNNVETEDSSLLRSFRDSCKAFLGTASVIIPDKNRETEETCLTSASGSHNGSVSTFCKKQENQVMNKTVSWISDCELEVRQDHLKQSRHNSGQINSRIESYSVPYDNESCSVPCDNESYSVPCDNESCSVPCDNEEVGMSSQNERMSSNFEELKCLDTWLESLLCIQDSATESLRSGSSTVSNDSKILEDCFLISELVSNASKSGKNIDTKGTPSKGVDDKLNPVKQNSVLSAYGSVKESLRSEKSLLYNKKLYGKDHKKVAVDNTLKTPGKNSQKKIANDISKIPENREQKRAFEVFSKMPETKSQKEAVEGAFKIPPQKIRERGGEDASKTPEKKSRKETIGNTCKITGRKSHKDALEVDSKMVKKNSQKESTKDASKVHEIKTEPEGDAPKIPEIRKEAVEDTSQMPGKKSKKEVLEDACRMHKKRSHKWVVEDISKRPEKVSQNTLMSSTYGKSKRIALEKTMSSSLIDRLKQKKCDPVLSFHDSVKKRARVEHDGIMNNNLEGNDTFNVPTITSQSTLMSSTSEKLEGNSAVKTVQSISNRRQTVSAQTPIPQLQNISMLNTPNMLNNLDFDQVATPLLVGLQNVKEENPMLSFFKGILPGLTSFNDDEYIEFQSDVISSIQKIKSKRENDRR